MSAYIGSKSPDDLLARAQLLEAVGESQLDALDGMELARTDKANKDSAARAALDLANQKEADAQAAKQAADAASAAAQQAQTDQVAATQQLQSQKDSAESQLAAAQADVDRPAEPAAALPGLARRQAGGGRRERAAGLPAAVVAVAGAGAGHRPAGRPAR